MKLIVWFYNIILLYPISSVVNLIYLYKNRSRLSMARSIHYVFRQLVSRESLEKEIAHLFKNHFYVRDFLNGFLNWIPFSTIQFFANRGGDCSVTARTIYLLYMNMYKKGLIKYKPQLYMLIDGINIKTAHVVCVIKTSNTQLTLWNVSKKLENLNIRYWSRIFQEKEMIAIGEKGYKYSSKMSVHKWR